MLVIFGNVSFNGLLLFGVGRLEGPVFSVLDLSFDSQTFDSWLGRHGFARNSSFIVIVRRPWQLLLRLPWKQPYPPNIWYISEHSRYFPLCRCWDDISYRAVVLSWKVMGQSFHYPCRRCTVSFHLLGRGRSASISLLPPVVQFPDNLHHRQGTRYNVLKVHHHARFRVIAPGETASAAIREPRHNNSVDNIEETDPPINPFNHFN